MHARLGALTLLLVVGCGPQTDDVTQLGGRPVPPPDAPPPGTTPPGSTPPSTTPPVTDPPTPSTDSICPSFTTDGAAPIAALGGETSAHILRANGTTVALEFELPDVTWAEADTSVSLAGDRALVHTRLQGVDQSFLSIAVLSLFTIEGELLWSQQLEFVQQSWLGEAGHVLHDGGSGLTIITPEGDESTANDTFPIGAPVGRFAPVRVYERSNRWLVGWLDLDSQAFVPMVRTPISGSRQVILHNRYLTAVTNDAAGPTLRMQAPGSNSPSAHSLDIDGAVTIQSVHPEGWLIVGTETQSLRVEVLEDGRVSISSIPQRWSDGVRAMDGCQFSPPSVDRRGRVLMALRNDRVGFMSVMEGDDQSWRALEGDFWDAQWVRTRSGDGVFVSEVRATEQTFCDGGNWPEEPDSDATRESHTRLVFLRDGRWSTEVVDGVSLYPTPVGACVIERRFERETQQTTATFRDLSRDDTTVDLPSTRFIAWFPPR